MKKLFKESLSLALIVCLLFTGTSAVFAENASSSEQPAVVTLDGISYDMSGSNGIDNKAYSIAAQYSIINNSAVISISSLDGSNASLRNVRLTKSLPGTFMGNVDEDTSVVLDMTSGSPLVDVLHDGKAYAFGGGEKRQAKIRAELSKLSTGNVVSTNMRASRSGARQIKDVSSDLYNMPISFNPINSNKVEFVLQTKTYKPATFVTYVKIKDGYVNTGSSGVSILGVNPTGSSSGINWRQTIEDVLVSLIPFDIFIPAYDGGSKGAYGGNSFWFNLGMNVPWNEMQGKNATVMRVYLDQNPSHLDVTGTLTVSYRVSATGSFTDRIRF